jgi:hypothetical protein
VLAPQIAIRVTGCQSGVMRVWNDRSVGYWIYESDSYVVPEKCFYLIILEKAKSH